MNKAKFIFAALIMFATIGGIFAFKATKFTGLFAWTTTEADYTFTTAQGGPTYTAVDLTYCTTTHSARLVGPGTMANAPTTATPAQITGTGPGNQTTTIQHPFKVCGPNVNLFLTTAV